MVPGFNHNVMHKGKMFHIQTEDSGPKRPYIITHLFMDGGRIIDSRKTSYDDIVGMPEMDDVVREMMEEQHKNMLRDLKDGKYNHVLGPEDSGPEETAGAPSAKKSLDEMMDANKTLNDVVLDFLRTQD